MKLVIVRLITCLQDFVGDMLGMTNAKMESIVAPLRAIVTVYTTCNNGYIFTERVRCPEKNKVVYTSNWSRIIGGLKINPGIGGTTAISDELRDFHKLCF